jgi:hypothetical protein
MRLVLSSTITTNELDLTAALAESLPAQMSAYFLDLEGLLSRIDSATTSYQVLGVERTDGQEIIKASFQQALNLLFPADVIGRQMPADITPRIDRAYQKVSQAFAVLASFAKRKEYDGTLSSVSNTTPKPGVPTPSSNLSGSVRLNRPNHLASAVVAADLEQLNLNRIPQRGAVYRESHATRTSDNRRRCERFKLSIPVRVTGHDRRNGKWHEMAQTVDVSRTGISLRLRKRVKPGTVLYVTLPLPNKLRAHGFAEQSYNVYTLIRRVEPARQGSRAVGVEFIGAHPPAGFLDKPWAAFRPGRWGGSERRRPDREEQIEQIRIDYLDESMGLLAQEEARTENVSRSGLRVSGTAAPAEFDLVMISCPRLKFQCMATLRSRYMGKDGRERICVQFVDKEWPS